MNPIIERSPETSAVDLERLRPSPTPPPANGKGAPNIRRDVNADRVCVLTFDRPNSAANIFDLATLQELNEHLEFVAAERGLAGLVLVSAKKNIFIAGADLHSIAAETDRENLRKLIAFGQLVFNRLAALPIPTVAAIHGACVGGGYEVALACDWRIASDARATRVGLPEVQLGLIPAWGGSTRLPRLIGLPKALDAILAGRTFPAKPALKRGLIDSVVPREYLLTAALKKLRAGKARRSPLLATNNLVVGAALRIYLRRQLLKKTRGHYPAVLKALDVATRGIGGSVANSLRLELDAILELSQSPVTRNLIQLFFLQERAKKMKGDAPRASVDGAPEKATLHCAVIGAGVMGSGIAQWVSAKGLPVILRDVNAEQVARGLANISKLYKEGVKRHTFTPVEARAGMDRISPATGNVPMRQADLVIEAAVEDLGVKKELFKTLEKAASDRTILATNTSALPISEIAEVLTRPERMVGIHFFNPVHRMQLVEVVRAKQTSAATVEGALHFVQRIGKLPLVVNDSPGFLVNRILVPYLIEAGILFENGALAEDIDEAMLDFGMPMGPLRLLDEVGLDVAHHISRTIADKFRDRFRVPLVLDRMVKAGWLGKKNGRGFYVHTRGASTPELNAQADPLRASNQARTLTRHELQERMVLLMVNEAARCLEEHVVGSAADVDFGMVMGTGFAPFRGGPLRYADAVGIDRIVASMRSWVKAGVTAMEPCDLLKSMAEKQETFYKATGGAV
jgi:3-hydroxyacyl-CoA dehydrogenase/enoyl-CoA hydratase/3-hydroxybutyryl-CoA epimerase